MSESNYSFKLNSNNGKLEDRAQQVARFLYEPDSRVSPSIFRDDNGGVLPFRAVMAVALNLLGTAVEAYKAEQDALGGAGQPYSLYSVLRWAESMLNQDAPVKKDDPLEGMSELLLTEVESIKRMLAELSSAGIQLTVDKPKKDKRTVAASLLANMSKGFTSHDD